MTYVSQSRLASSGHYKLIALFDRKHVLRCRLPNAYHKPNSNNVYI
jgi:hypothetical protein